MRGHENGRVAEDSEARFKFDMIKFLLNNNISVIFIYSESDD